jgi:hypothetical protein
MFNCPEKQWLLREIKILRIFKRKAHLLLSRTPAETETLEWLAIMQHHGAPTRLLDFMWSPYVAAFFALERATEDSAIWAISPGPEVPNYRGLDISTLLNKMMAPDREPGVSRKRPARFDDPGTSNAVTKQAADAEGIPGAIIGEPILMNQRMTTQAGTFVIPTVRIDVPLDQIVPSSSVFKLTLTTKSLRRETMDRLFNMNINNATLFPGIDGLARSLAFGLEFEWRVDPDAAKRLAGKGGEGTSLDSQRPKSGKA